VDASLVKWTKKLVPNVEITKFEVKGYKVIPKCLLSWICFYGAPYCCYKYSLSTVSKHYLPKNSLKIKSKNKYMNVSDVNFMILNVLNFNF
jgi:hypothetical protein